MTDKIKTYFDTHPSSEECYSTSDGFLFHNKSDAQAHATVLEDKTVSEHLRGQEDIKEDPKVEIPKGIPDEAWTVVQIKAYMEANGIEGDGNKAELLEMITNSETYEDELP